MFVSDATILHADLDAFYASVEQRDDPWLRGRPVVVGGGVVLAASYEAKAYGIKTAMSGRAARALCPGLISVPPRMDAYTRASRDVFAVFDRTSPIVEGISIDEAFLDVGGLRRIAGTPLEITTRLRRDVAADGRCTYVHATALKLLDAEDFPSRLGLLCEGLEALLDEWQPQQVAIETVFMDKSATSALKLGHARGAALATVVRRRLPISEYPPRVIKQSLVGRGAADKQQVQHMVRTLLAIHAALEADEADALAAALCHAHSRTLNERYAVLTEATRRRSRTRPRTAPVSKR